jgi:gamma-glutamyltranspeptidase/glutathione hydrolase
MKASRGVVAAGHPKTAEAAGTALAAGGNAFDAAVAACFAACVAEPVLASLGGGGFLLAKPAHGEPLLYDFFAQTPRRKRIERETDLRPVLVNFGDATQEFHIGFGSIATPGAVAGLFAIHRDLCRLPLSVLVAPARDFARRGMMLTAAQHHLATIVEPILRASPEAFAAHASPSRPGDLALPGETVHQPALAEALELLVTEGQGLFYEGDWAERLVADCGRAGGHLTREDLSGYRVVRRTPRALEYRNSHVFTNPPPALGGGLILFALRLLAEMELGAYPHGQADHVHALATAMRLTQRLRQEGLTDIDPNEDPLALEILATMQREAVFPRGTTQISVADVEGNLAGLTISNGEGSGYVLPGTGIVLNNMLGEEDINPEGFHRWPRDRRISSMMSPTLLELPDGSSVVTGSSGSNRIRSAVLQVISNLVDFGLPLDQAVGAPRIHYEGGLLNLEPPVPSSTLGALQTRWPRIKLWSALNVFFGGAHSVCRKADGSLLGAGDPRRGGTALVV